MSQKQTPEREYRASEIRAEVDDTTVTIRGKALPFNTETKMGNFFTERFEQGSFRNSLKAPDIVLLAGHDGMPMARTGGETLSFREEEDGLHFEASLDRRDAFSESMAIKIERRDLTGVSIGFRAISENWVKGDSARGILPARTIREAELLEVSLTPFPAYKDTDVITVRDRGLASIKKEFDSGGESDNRESLGSVRNW